MYGLFVNYVAGEEYIIPIDEKTPRQDGYFSCIAEFETWEEAEAHVQKMREESEVFAVFFNHAAGEGFVSREDCFTGNWRGTKYAPYSLCGEYASEDEAFEALAKLQG